jgi:3-oxoadipate CoA-transferase, beta subunit
MTPNTNVHRRTREEIAARVAVDLAPGTVVNLGIGMPTLVADHLDPSREILVHSENGILGVGRAPDMARLDRDLINASKDPVTLVPGGSFFNHAESFAMIRGGHIDVAIMGAFEVSCGGDLANWSAGGSTVPAVGGAMDLAVGSKAVFVIMKHQGKSGEPKLVRECTLPLTARGCVKRVYTDLAVLEIVDGEFVVSEAVPGATIHYLRSVTGAPIRMA